MNMSFREAEQRCTDKTDSRRTFAWVLIGLGAVAVVGNMVTKPRR